MRLNKTLAIQFISIFRKMSDPYLGSSALIQILEISYDKKTIKAFINNSHNNDLDYQDIARELVLASYSTLSIRPEIDLQNLPTTKKQQKLEFLGLTQPQLQLTLALQLTGN